MASVVIIKNGDLTVGEFKVSNGDTIGRDSRCKINLDDPMISREHARFVIRDDHWFLEDLNSANGILENGQQKTLISLEDDLVIEIPPYSLHVKGLSSDSGHDDDFDKPKSLGDLLEPGFKMNSDDYSMPKTKKAFHPDNDMTDIGTPELDVYSDSGFSYIGESQNHLLDEQPKPDLSNPDNSTMLLDNVVAARLFPLNIQLNNVQLTLADYEFIIGRSPETILTIPHASVSKLHASIYREDGEYFIKDLDSTNGTRVNGEQIDEFLLRCHDVIDIGEIRFEFLEGAATPQAHSMNVIEVADSPAFSVVTDKPPSGQLTTNFRNLISVGLAMILLIMVSLPLLRSGNDKQKDRLIQSAKVPLQEVLSPEVIAAREQKRIVRHQMTQIRHLMSREKYDEAIIKVKLVLEDLDPENKEALMVKKELDQIALKEEQKRIAAQERKTKSIERLRRLMKQAGQATDEKRFAEAKALYREILAIEPGYQLAKEKLSDISELVTKEKQASAQRSILNNNTNEAFTQGMVAYNSNNFAQAAQYLRQVVGIPDHQHYSAARIALDDIEERLAIETKDKINEAKEYYLSNNLIVARKLLGEILLGSPGHEEAIKLQEQVIKDAREQAKQLFREGYTFENLVQDYSTAKDRYQSVLDLLPETDEEYHQKARQRLGALN